MSQLILTKRFTPSKDLLNEFAIDEDLSSATWML